MENPKLLEESLRNTLEIMLETDPDAVLKIERIKSEVLGLHRLVELVPAQKAQMLS